MYYILHDRTGGLAEDAFDCYIEKFEGWSSIWWNSGKKIYHPRLKDTLIYYSDSKEKVKPNDYLKTISGQILFSEKMIMVAKKKGACEFDSYPSKIVRKTGEVIEGYYTINILSDVHCVDMEKSLYRKHKRYKDSFEYKKLCLDEKKIPDKLLLFTLAGTINIIIEQQLLDEFIKEKVTGISIERLCVERHDYDVGILPRYWENVDV